MTEKPRISMQRMMFGQRAPWVCCGLRHGGVQIGSGMTPTEAYEQWAAIPAYTFGIACGWDFTKPGKATYDQ